jgi:hypothetical protein
MFVKGSCHCGQIKFEAEVDPSQFQICHCFDCQTLTGTAFRSAVPASPEHFQMTQGEPKIYLKIADSGSRRNHAFCGNCGTPVYRMPTDNNPNYSLRIGTLEQRMEFETPLRQIWVKRRMPWLTEIASVPEVDGQG